MPVHISMELITCTLYLIIILCSFCPLLLISCIIFFYDSFGKFSIEITYHQNRVTCQWGSLYLKRQIFVEMSYFVYIITLWSINYQQSEIHIPKFHFYCGKLCIFTFINYDRWAGPFIVLLLFSLTEFLLMRYHLISYDREPLISQSILPRWWYIVFPQLSFTDHSNLQSRTSIWSRQHWGE